MASTGIFRYVKPNESRRIGLGIILGTVTNAEDVVGMRDPIRNRRTFTDYREFASFEVRGVLWR